MCIVVQTYTTCFVVKGIKSGIDFLQGDVFLTSQYCLFNRYQAGGTKITTVTHFESLDLLT